MRRDQAGPFQIQAAIAAVHADAATAEATDWSQIVALYDQLYALRPNAVVALNRADRRRELRGPADGLLDALELLDDQPARGLPALPRGAGRRSWLERGVLTRRAHAYDRAIELSANPTEQRFLEQRRGALDDVR